MAKTMPAALTTLDSSKMIYPTDKEPSSLKNSASSEISKQEYSKAEVNSGLMEFSSKESIKMENESTAGCLVKTLRTMATLNVSSIMEKVL